MIFWLLCLIVAVSADCECTCTPTPIPKACQPGGHKVNLTTSGYSLPLTSFPSNHYCIYKFTVPKGYFAYVELNAYKLQWLEDATILDESGTEVSNDNNKLGFNDYYSELSWPIDFSVVIATLNETSVQMSLDIYLMKEKPMVDIVKSYVTFPGAASVFLFPNQFHNGESYKFTSKSKDGKIYLMTAAMTNATGSDEGVWNNIFIYDGGVFNGTVAHYAQWLEDGGYISTSNEVVLYCTMKFDVLGALMVTDYSNVQSVTHRLRYVSPNTGRFGVQVGPIESESAYTLVSSRDNPAKLNATEIKNLQGQPQEGVISYIVGGPIQNHSNAVNLTNALPKMITGYANTFYLSKGGDVIWFEGY